MSSHLLLRSELSVVSQLQVCNYLAQSRHLHRRHAAGLGYGAASVHGAPKIRWLITTVSRKQTEKRGEGGGGGGRGAMRRGERRGRQISHRAAAPWRGATVVPPV
eukprot:SAG31_NODE_22384_length_527_cov_0.616822_2_plen_104_part_01